MAIVHEGSGGPAAERVELAHLEAVALWERAAGGLGAAPCSGPAGHRVTAALGALTGPGRPWRLLADRRTRGDRGLGVELLLVGPPGVFVIGVQRWVPRPAPRGGRPFAGGGHGVGGEMDGPGAPGHRDLAALRAAADLAEQGVAAIGLSPLAVSPVLVVDGHRLDTVLGRVHVLGTADLLPALLRLPARLPADRVDAVAACLAAAFPPAGGRRCGGARPGEPFPAGRGLPGGGPSPGGDGRELFAVWEVAEALRAAALDAPLEHWMTFLHPAQVALARRRFTGPARIAGAAGTGKTVVALHRAAHLARRDGGPVLLVTCAGTLPRVLDAGLRRLAGPHVAARVETTSLPGWATGFLRGRDRAVALDPRRARAALRTAWARTGRASVLAALCDDPRYWSDEIEHVIKGRGVTSYEQYTRLHRHGRRAVLRTRQREAVWRLYEDYERLLAAGGIADRPDLIAAALDEVRRLPPGTDYTAVIVDEAQDLSLVGLRLLHALVGDRPDGLLLVGDGQQSVFPGAFPPQDAGVRLRGRTEVLRVNHRGSRPIAAAARALVDGDPHDDAGVLVGADHHGPVVTPRDGPRPHRVVVPDATSHDQALLAAVGDLVPGLAATGPPRAAPAPGGAPYGAPPGGGFVPPRRQDAAVLCASAAQADRYAALLRRAGIPTLPLHRDDGAPGDAVRIGTYLAARGLEFGHVFLPHADGAAHDDRAHDDSADRDAADGVTAHVGTAHVGTAHVGTAHVGTAADGATTPGAAPAGVAGSVVAAVAGELAEVERRRRYVGMTRARETLWIGVIRPPAPDS
ncbi:DNA helicase [Frankia canadensis]|uniref:DNA helicase n=1 Tax=Frankia canadensis TaxID=1836972 RepID=A0A2I2KQR8_9ACTN|nr:UvrD-helicase domain-containing protein [Frankia canadensis]SNQ48015.1 DNA helicase [Frankia canadensis]SOU55305.1 DNA helicase [Frankia canadensis]